MTKTLPLKLPPNKQNAWHDVHDDNLLWSALHRLIGKVLLKKWGTLWPEVYRRFLDDDYNLLWCALHRLIERSAVFMPPALHTCEAVQ